MNDNFGAIKARQGSDRLYSVLMAMAFNPAKGREMQLAHIYDKPDTRFPLAEFSREHERSENNNSPAKVYKISKHPRFKAHNQNPGEKSKGDKPYDPYEPGYGGKYIGDNIAALYDQKSKKEDAKSLYSVKTPEQKSKRVLTEYFRGGYNAEHANDNEKTEGLYQRSVRMLSQIYNAVLNKTGKYFANAAYNQKSPAVAENQDYGQFGNGYLMSLSGSYLKGISYSGATVFRMPANDNYGLEQRANVKTHSEFSRLERLVA